ncbi:sulfite exporter TauE/SafE family protein [Candidatus Roseilinea sp. NK_OTU-006]|uniref:sulfite exporter TauE/SafE family protein n=1 Tax=Candidatus Roseilinea sp. NK_OTU-006 TaxID=2704250 RepID=UPI00145E8483|nr:sulfite exporter TauE/SafE family protein [Candidatus Roseilinea sp. NK_OTU-006]
MFSNEFWWFVLVGFAAQMVDGALGMAYGTVASSLLITLGVPPVLSSATVHTAECFTTGASAIAHRAFGNVDQRLLRGLVAPAILGAVLGALILSHLPGEALRPYIALYLLIMGLVIIGKAFRQLPPRTVTEHLGTLGFVGAFLDTVGGGGWGPIVATTLLSRGNHVRTAIGSANAVEFFVTLAATATFTTTLSFNHWTAVIGLALGGLPAAPLAAWLTKRLPLRPLMVMIGLVVVALSLRTLIFG